MRKALSSVLYLGPSILWALVILKLLLTSSTKLPRFPILLSIPHLDKIVHAILFGVWMTAMLWASVKQFKTINGWKVALVLVFVMGLSTELIQEFAIVTRLGSAGDFAADVGGGLLALAIMFKPMKAMIVES